MTSLSGCGVRLEDGAPDIPFVPEREPIPGEAPLLALLGVLDHSDEQHAAERADLLRAALTRAQVPERLASAPAAPAAGEVVFAYEFSVRECGPALLPLTGRLLATRRITTDSRDEQWSEPSPAAWKDGSVAAEALEATRAARYAVELIAAKTKDDKAAATILEASQGLGDLLARQTTAAGESIGKAALGYDVPHTFTAAEATQLGTQTFTRLLAAYANGFARLGEDRQAALEVVEWMVTAERLSRAPFPLEVPVLYGGAPAGS